MLLVTGGFLPRFAALFRGLSLIFVATLLHKKSEEVTMKKIAALLTNQNYLACVVAALLFIVTADNIHLRDSISHGLQAVFDAKG